MAASGKRMGSEEFQAVVRDCVSSCKGSGYDLFDKFGDPCNPVTILLDRLKVPALWVQFWANVKATHTPMKEKLEEFLTANQVQVVQKLEEIYMTSNGSTAQMKKEMLEILKMTGQK